MSAQQLHPASLADAQRRINNLREELDWTVESVARLERIGQHDLALKLVDEQRDALGKFVHLLAGDVTPLSPRLSRRRRIALFVAASLALVLGFASIGVAHNRTPSLQAMNTRFTRAEAIADPVARLRELISVYEGARKVSGSRDLRSQIAEVAGRTIPAVRRDDHQADLVDQANKMIKDASTGPSSDGSPVTHLQHDITGS